MIRVVLSILLIVSIIGADPCPDGYIQAPNGGDCFQTIKYKDFFTENYFPQSYDAAETDCNNNYWGGLLASLHSSEENNFIGFNCGVSGATLNIGLKCKGMLCKWDDGSPITYTNFAGDGPSDSDGDACYAVGSKGKWVRKDCGQQKADCWICRVKARTIECTDAEYERNGGCVSVHLAPLDQKSAQQSCPNGGHLVSIHSKNEIIWYTAIAQESGANGSIYIGGQYTNGVFEWADGSYKNYANWANGFPNTIFGACVQMLLDSAFGVQGQWTNVDCATKQAYFCFRDGATYGPTVAPQPKANPKCPPVQYYTGIGNVSYFSLNFDIFTQLSAVHSCSHQQTCEYVVGVNEGAQASVKFTSYDCESGTTLSFFDGLNSNQPYLKFTTDSPILNQVYSTSTNVMKIVFSANGTAAPVGTGWEAEFAEI